MIDFKMAGIKSIEIFMTPNDLKWKHPNIFSKVEGFIDYDKTTVRINSKNIEFMENVYDVCDKENIRCQRYIV